MSNIELLIFLPQICFSYRVLHRSEQLHSSSYASQKHWSFPCLLSLHPLLDPLATPINFTLKDIEILRISPHLTFSTATTQVPATIISHLDYCTCFLISPSLCTWPYLPHEQSTMISLTSSPASLPCSLTVQSCSCVRDITLAVLSV